MIIGPSDYLIDVAQKLIPRSYHQLRDWKRPWKDRPGLWGDYCCCPSGKSSSPSSFCGCSSLVKGTNYHLTFSNSGTCPAIDAQTFLLTYRGVTANGYDWNIFGGPGPGSFQCCQAGGLRQYDINFGCNGTTPPFPCNNAFLSVSTKITGNPCGGVTATCCFGGGTIVSCQCNPINFVFSWDTGATATVTL